MDIDHIVTLLTALAWPAVAMTFIVFFRKQIATRIDSLRTAQIPGGFALRFNAEAVEKIIEEGQQRHVPAKEVAERILRTSEILHPLAIHWASQHGAHNPFDMGEKNWKRFLYDHGLPGGEYHDLTYENGSLKHQ